MIKKIFSQAAIIAFVASMTLTACSESKTEKQGPSTPEEYAKEKARLDKERADAAMAGDNAQLKKLGIEWESLEEEIKAECTEDNEFKSAFEKAYEIEFENAMAQ